MFKLWKKGSPAAKLWESPLPGWLKPYTI